VVLDSPPVNLISDAALLAVKADGVIMVARAGFTDAGALAHAMDQLRHVRAPVLGVVLNDVDYKRDVGYDPGYYAYEPDASAVGASGS
jgi:Mrp family chromosome partitioning ATPase